MIKIKKYNSILKNFAEGESLIEKICVKCKVTKFFTFKQLHQAYLYKESYHDIVKTRMKMIHQANLRAFGKHKAQGANSFYFPSIKSQNTLQYLILDLPQCIFDAT